MGGRQDTWGKSWVRRHLDIGDIKTSATSGQNQLAKDKYAPPPTCVSDKVVSKKQKTVTSTMVTVAVEFWTLKGILFHWNQSVSSKRLELNFFSENNSLPWNHENGINIWIEIIQALLSFPVSNDSSIYEWSDMRTRTEQNIQIVYFIVSTTGRCGTVMFSWVALTKSRSPDVTHN